MIQPQLFGPGGDIPQGNIPAQCRAAAREKCNKHGGQMKLVESEFEYRSNGCTADHVADIHALVLNTARRCVHYLAAEGTLLPIGIGQSRYHNPQTIYVHKKYAAQHQAAIIANTTTAAEPTQETGTK